MKIEIEVPDYDTTKWNTPKVMKPEKGLLYLKLDNGVLIWELIEKFTITHPKKNICCTPKVKPVEEVLAYGVGHKTTDRAKRAIKHLESNGYKIVRDPEWLR